MEGPESAVTRISPEDLAAFCVAGMVKSGMRDEDARVTAEVLVTNDTWGIHTHGTKLLRPLWQNVRDGRLDVQAVPEVICEGPAWAIIDGHYAMPMVSSYLAMETAIEKAKATGIAYTGVRHSSQFGAAGYYANMAVEEDMMGLAMSNVDLNMAAPGARGGVIGNNPLAYAVPAGEERPVFLDIAMSTVAGGKIYIADFQGTQVPDNWLVDEDGLPTTDPASYMVTSVLAPMTGHKGYGLAVMVEVLAAVLSGAGVTNEVQGWLGDSLEPTNEGHGFIAIDVGAMMPIGQFKSRMDRMIRQIKQSPKAKGSDRIYLPGEMEWEKREEALGKGIALPEDVIANLTGWAGDVGLETEGLFG